MPMTQAEFFFFKELIEKQTGIALNDTKITLVQSRLGKRLRDLDVSSYHDYIRLLKEDKTNEEMTYFINSLTTNKTDFFREIGHFEFLKEHWAKKFQKRTCYLWSAASSNGSEAYTISILGEEFRAENPIFDYKILGSDIDSDMLEKASKGIYMKNELSGLQPLHQAKYLDKGTGSNNGRFRVKQELRQKVKFRQFNLIDPNEKIDFQFDIIFLRNVLIYFSTETIAKVITKMHRHIKPDGLLFIGHSENLHGLQDKFQGIGSSIYQAKK
jgi:chemotaxis protein methyltransferase CheR